VTPREFNDRLSRRARKAGLTVQSELCDRLWVYFQLLTKWNQKINLTVIELAEPGPEGFDRLLLEPLAAAAHANDVRRLIDIGSGGGSPAIPLALAVGDVRLVMVEVKTRKSVFLREAARELGLDATVVTTRHESLLADPSFHDAYDLLSIRAVRVESRMFAALQAFIRPGGRIFHFRTATDIQPLLPPQLSMVSVVPLIDGAKSQLAVVQKLKERGVPRGTQTQVTQS
jgi:16S rRNA (guanine527-N7)-methyltransferase